MPRLGCHDEEECDELPTINSEREAFVQLNPPGFFIRPPPAPDRLATFITPDDELFQTIHMGVAEVDVERWILVVDGMVERPFSINLEQLQGMPSTTVTSFHECYGSPLVPPTKALRRIGNVTWTGVPLRDLLAKAQPKPEARYVWSEGLDRGEFGGVQADRYQKDLPMEKALEPEVLVAYKVNGQPLNKARGAPVRLLVPGFFGTNSTKWLSKLSVQASRAPGPFTTTFYNEHYPPDDPTCESKPIWKVQPNSMIVRPAPDSSHTGPDVTVEGWAWGYDGAAEVNVSSNEGKTWTVSDLEERDEYSWQRFRARLKLPAGSHTLLARARSPGGRSQPLGEGRNHVHRVSIEIN